MFVPSYQMHNVLKVYSKQLRQNMAAKRKNKVPQKPQVNKYKLTPEFKNKVFNHEDFNDRLLWQQVLSC